MQGNEFRLFFWTMAFPPTQFWVESLSQAMAPTTAIVPRLSLEPITFPCRANALIIMPRTWAILVVTTAEKRELVDITTLHVFFMYFFSSSLVSNPAECYL